MRPDSHDRRLSDLADAGKPDLRFLCDRRGGTSRKAGAGSWQANMTGDAELMLSGWLIFLAMVFDGLDGYVARLARTTSDFGAQLDSLCDVVSSGWRRASCW